jgi:kynurenine formamidase
MRRRRQYEFMRAAAPLQITGAVGSPVGAVAIR